MCKLTFVLWYQIALFIRNKKIPVNKLEVRWTTPAFNPSWPRWSKRGGCWIFLILKSVVLVPHWLNWNCSSWSVDHQGAMGITTYLNFGQNKIAVVLVKIESWTSIDPPEALSAYTLWVTRGLFHTSLKPLKIGIANLKMPVPKSAVKGFEQYGRYGNWSYI